MYQRYMRYGYAIDAFLTTICVNFLANDAHSRYIVALYHAKKAFVNMKKLFQTGRALLSGQRTVPPFYAAGSGTDSVLPRYV